jgi:hypothetical protein
MPCERGVVDAQQLGVVGRTGIRRDAHTHGNADRWQVGQRPPHLQQLAHDDQAQSGRRRTRGLQVAVRPDAGAVAALRQPGARHRRADAPAPCARMHHQLGHRRLVGEVQIADNVITVDGEQVPGAVVRQFAEHLVTDGRDAISLFRRRDQLADPALLIPGQAHAPADRRH